MDVIDELAGIARGSALDGLRENRHVARAQSQRAFEALFAPLDEGEVTCGERAAVAAFVAGLHGEAAAAGFYAGRVADGLRGVVAGEVAAGAGPGPYGAYPPGPLSGEDVAGPVYRVGAREALGPRLAAAFEHAHMLVLHPRDAAAPSLQALLDAGWGLGGIVTLSQLVAFVSYQVRVSAGLRVLAGHPPAEAGA